MLAPYLRQLEPEVGMAMLLGAGHTIVESCYIMATTIDLPLGDAKVIATRLSGAEPAVSPETEAALRRHVDGDDH